MNFMHTSARIATKLGTLPFVLVLFGVLAAAPAGADDTPLVNDSGWLTQDGRVIWGWAQHNGWWRPGQRANLTRRSVGDPEGDIRPNRTEDLSKLAGSMLQYGYPGIEHNFGLWYDRRRDAHDAARRVDAHVAPPFLEQPWARVADTSPEHAAWDGLPRYDLTQFNDWYFERLAAFASECDARGTVLIHKYYMQHALLEIPPHYIDFPWHPANCIQATSMPDTVPAANAFYDVSNPIRRELHRQYIFKCLDVLGSHRNVIHAISQEYTGPLSFAEFWLDTVHEWEEAQGRVVCVALGATKDVQDAILGDPVRGPRIDVLDLRYWWYTADGSLYAPEGGRELPGRDFDQGGRQGKESPAQQIYRKVAAYKARYPEKAVIDAIEGDRRQNWAFLMAGGSLLVRGLSYPDNADPTTYVQPANVEIILPTYTFLREHLAKVLPHLRPVPGPEADGTVVWLLADDVGNGLWYLPEGGALALDKAQVPAGATVLGFDPKTGTTRDLKPEERDRRLVYSFPDAEDWALAVLRK